MGAVVELFMCPHSLHNKVGQQKLSRHILGSEVKGCVTGRSRRKGDINLTPLTVGVRCLVLSSRRTLFKRLLFTILAPPPRHCSCPLSSPPLLFLSTLTFYPFGPSPVLLSFLLVCITTSKLLPITIMEWGLDVRRRRLANMYIQRNRRCLDINT